MEGTGTPSSGPAWCAGRSAGPGPASLAGPALQEGAEIPPTPPRAPDSAAAGRGNRRFLDRSPSRGACRVAQIFLVKEVGSGALVPASGFLAGAWGPGSWAHCAPTSWARCLSPVHRPLWLPSAHCSPGLRPSCCHTGRPAVLLPLAPAAPPFRPPASCSVRCPCVSILFQEALLGSIPATDLPGGGDGRDSVFVSIGAGPDSPVDVGLRGWEQ